jgi:DNA-binding NarL/FixJ family response regulator
LPPNPKDSPGKRRRKLLIVDDNRFFIRSLKSLIDGEPDMVVCDLAESSEQLFRAIKQSSPDMIVLDLMLGEENGLQIAEKLRRQGVKTPLLLISSLATPSRKDLQQIGRCVFCRKGDIPEKLLHRARTGLMMTGDCWKQAKRAKQAA